MEKEPGDDYIRRFAAFLRSQERQLAGGGVGRPRQNTSSSFSSVLGWIGIDVSSPSPNLRPPPTILSIDLHHLFYLLIRLEDFGIDVGSLDVKLQSNSRPVSYASLLAAAKDGSDTLSIASIATSISKLSIGSGWWGIGQPRKPDLDLKYIYSCFTILPALSLCQSDLKVIAELATDPPTDTAIPLDAFKFLQRLELLDIDPRNVLGWDRLSESLHSLTVKRSGVEDVSDILIDAVADDEVRRHGKGGPTVGRLRQPSQRYPSSRSRKFPPLGIPTPISEHVAEDACSTEIGLPEESQATKLSKHKWRLLKHLSLADNALTFLPTAPLPHLASLTHLDLSSNLLVSVPPGLSELYNLVSLNLSDNMIDSVLGIYTQLGQILILNLSKNRLESLCGLERLLALERVDVKHNRLADTGEVGRLAILPNITEVSVEGNPFTHLYQDYRVRCFDHFANEGKSISVDGTGPSFFESRNVKVVSRPEVDGSNTTVSRRKSTALVPASPPVVSIGATVPETPSKRSRQSVDTTNFVSTNTQQFLTSEHLPMSPSPSGVGINSPLSDTASSRKVKAAKRKLKRIVDLDGNQIADGSASDNTISSGPKPKYRAKARHARGASEGLTWMMHSLVLSIHLMLLHGSTLPPRSKRPQRQWLHVSRSKALVILLHPTQLPFGGLAPEPSNPTPDEVGILGSRPKAIWPRQQQRAWGKLRPMVAVCLPPCVSLWSPA
ncbi:uncharacterized protein EI90DRAFT_2170785 [Cantharellus anzutake]|uniref:uncharacterized protein n=1 Tax=Cantharellus anzutake TaxID=1750568 RepID=UPI0019039674|nr:uncharacterized protein EI90DRAFT_2170785 [Cantharellus anzutake]KAF8325160.1 hypothetical protein EI90DRAFT_2170785 [Cantharellus anzutake]